MCSRCQAQRGFTYIGLLLAIALLGLALSAIGVVWRVQAQREREQELLFIGHEFRAAIRSYYAAGGSQYPQRIEDLLTDNRWPQPRHHLRKLYLDPMTGAADWQLLTIDAVGITGVASKSQGKPIKRSGFSRDDTNFTDADCYCAWQFVYMLRSTAHRRAH